MRYGQVGADGVWRDKNVDAPKGDTLEHSAVKVDISIELLAKLREYLREPRSRAELQKFCEIKSRDHFRNKILIPLIDSKKIKLTIPDKPTSSKQKYGSTAKVQNFHILWYSIALYNTSKQGKITPENTE